MFYKCRGSIMLGGDFGNWGGICWRRGDSKCKVILRCFSWKLVLLMILKCRPSRRRKISWRSIWIRCSNRKQHCRNSSCMNSEKYRNEDNRYNLRSATCNKRNNASKHKSKPSNTKYPQHTPSTKSINAYTTIFCYTSHKTNKKSTTKNNYYQH